MPRKSKTSAPGKRASSRVSASVTLGRCRQALRRFADDRVARAVARIAIAETWDLTTTPIEMLVGFSHEKVGEAVARHLLAKGHRRFGLVSSDDERASARRRGYTAELARAGIANLATVIVGPGRTRGSQIAPDREGRRR